jgi:RNA-directed DNA polymerase
MRQRSSAPDKLARTMRNKSGYVFISHASEEKKNIVIPLTLELDKLGIAYFLDVKEIQWGKSLNQSLSDGLRRSSYFLAFISENYVKKKWPMLELEAALNCQISDRPDFILPVLIGSPQQRKRIGEQISLLMNLRYLVWKNNPSEIAISIAERLRRK